MNTPSARQHRGYRNADVASIVEYVVALAERVRDGHLATLIEAKTLATSVLALVQRAAREGDRATIWKRAAKHNRAEMQRVRRLLRDALAADTPEPTNTEAT